MVRPDHAAEGTEPGINILGKEPQGDLIVESPMR
jgi:hypothetical protein